MHVKYLVAMTLLPGLFLASCSPSTEPAAPEASTDEAPAARLEEAMEPAAEVAPQAAPEQPAEPGVEDATEPPAAEPAADAPAEEAAGDAEWVALFNGENLDGWTQRGAATWEVVDGVLTGTSPGGQGHLYADPELTDLEVKGMFRLTSQGEPANSGLYFRANPPEDNIDGYPKGYEAQLCNTHDAFTGWLWKPGNPTGEASELLTEDGEWFSMRVKAVGPKIQIWVKDQLVMTYEDEEYKKGHFAIQCHNEGMTVEAKELYYRDLSGE